MDASDLQLLRQYSETRSEDAFAEIVRRHLDLVHSVALRQVRSPQGAEEVAQSVFVDLARSAHRLAANTVLAGWLHQVARRTAIDVVRRESKRVARERVAMEIHDASQGDSVWVRVAPLLDEALQELGAKDRAAILLRFYQNKPLREVAEALGIGGDDAAQKRVSRAVERLRVLFARRGVSLTAGGLAEAIASNAVASSPIQLAGTITSTAMGAATSAAVGVTGPAIATMNIISKSILTAVIVTAVSTALYQRRQADHWRARVDSLERDVSEAGMDLEKTQADRDAVAAEFAASRVATEQAKRDGQELSRLRRDIAELRAAKAGSAAPTAAAPGTALEGWLNRATAYKRLSVRMPDKAIPELRLLTEEDWFELSKDPLGQPASEVDLNDAKVARLALSAARAKAKDRLMRVMSRALEGYANEHDGELPSDPRQLQPHLMNKRFLGPARVVDVREDAIDSEVLDRYEIVSTGKFADVPSDRAIIVEKAPVDPEFDTCLRIGRFSMGLGGIKDYDLPRDSLGY